MSNSNSSALASMTLIGLPYTIATVTCGLFAPVASWTTDRNPINRDIPSGGKAASDYAMSVGEWPLGGAVRTPLAALAGVVGYWKTRLVEVSGSKMRQRRTGGNCSVHCLVGVARWSVIVLSGFVASPAHAQDVLPNTTYPVGMTQVEYIDPASGDRPLNYMLIYPAAPQVGATLFKIFLSTNLHLYKDAPIAAGGLKRPLVVFSHGAGGNGSGYAWFGEYLAARGYVVALVYHYRANTFDSSALYVRNRLWQRPRDISLDISHLLADTVWGPNIDPKQIGVAGHSQGGFTSLWIGGAKINSDLFAAYQRRWKENQVVPAYLREQMRIDAEPARDVRDSRIKAAFAMAPGDIQGFGMVSGLRTRQPRPRRTLNLL
jgi:hypothetical protein